MFKKISQKMKQRAHSGTQVILVLGILIVINLLIAPLNIRADLTEDKEFTLTKTTAEKLKNLDDVVNIELYFSQDVPSNLLGVRQEVQDLLAEYRNISGNKVRVKWIDPQDDPELKQKATSLGIPELQFNVLEKDAFQVTTGFAGLVIFYGDETEVIPAIENTDNFEYDITAAITKLTATETPVVGVSTGKGEKDLSYLFDLLGRQYEVRSLDMTDGELLADDIKTVIIPGPTEKLTDRELYVIDQFLMHGKNLIVLHDSIDIDQSLSTTVLDTGLEQVLEHYGVKLGNNLVLDPSSPENVTFGGGLFQVVVPYPFWPKVTGAGLDQQSPLTAQLQSLVLPWSRSLEFVQKNIAEGNKSEVLARVTSAGFVQTAPYNLDPQQDFSGSGTEHRDFPVAVSLSGKFSSFFADRDKPEKEGAEEKDEADFQADTGSGRLVVVGDSDFIREDLVNQFPDNVIFLANVVDGVTLDASLNSIRSRGITNRPLQPLSDTEKTTLKYGNIFSSVVLVLLLALGHWQWRKMKTRKALEQLGS